MRVELQPVRYWRHDLGHCLHTTAGVLLTHRGYDPVETLGAAWGFHYPGDLRREEYYLPGHGESLFSGLAPYHGIRSVWHRPENAEQGWQEVRAQIIAGNPVAVAADNYHLPFRPAYHDVHTNHLMVVYGFDDHAAEVLVADPVPPAFQDAVPLDAFTAARDSGNPVRHDRDMFFTANPIGNRWLEVHFDGPVPRLDEHFLRWVLTANMREMIEPADPATAGLPGLRTFLDCAWQRLPEEPDVVDEVFIVAGPTLAGTGLHACFLAAAGCRFRDAAALELSRMVDTVAHHWSALRIAVATARDRRAEAVPALHRRSERLLGEYERVVDAISRYLSGLSPTADGNAFAGAFAY